MKYKIGMVSFPIKYDGPSDGRTKTKKYFKGKKIDIVIDLINKNSDLDLLVFPGHTIFDLEDLHTLKSSIKNKKTLVFFEVWDGCRAKGEKHKAHKEFVVKKGKKEHKAFVIQDGEILDQEMFQYFATYKEIEGKSKDDIKDFLCHLRDDRVFSDEKRSINLRLLICGEQFILISKKKKSKEKKSKKKNKNKAFFRFDKESDLSSIFKEIHEETDIYINPTHTIMSRPHLSPSKREFFSANKRVYCTTTNYNMKNNPEDYKIKKNPKDKSHHEDIQYCLQNGKEKSPTKWEHEVDVYILKTYNLDL